MLCAYNILYRCCRRRPSPPIDAIAAADAAGRRSRMILAQKRRRRRKHNLPQSVNSVFPREECSLLQLLLLQSAILQSDGENNCTSRTHADHDNKHHITTDTHILRLLRSHAPTHTHTAARDVVRTRHRHKAATRGVSDWVWVLHVVVVAVVIAGRALDSNNADG